MNDHFDDDLEDFSSEAERAEARRRPLRQQRTGQRIRRLVASSPWVIVGVLAVASLVAGAGAWGLGAVTTVAVPAPPPTVSLTVARTIASYDGTATQPTGVAVSGDRLYVADPRRAVVDVLTREGGRVETIGAGQLETPVYVAVGPVDGHVYVSDRGRNAVLVFSQTGQRIGVLTPAGVRANARESAPWRPLALGFAPDGTLYVADSTADALIAVFSPIGSRIGTLGADVPAGRTGRKLAFPNGIAATASGIVVADSNNGRILFFGRDGAFTHAILTTGLPRGVAALAGGRIVVSDAAWSDLTVYNAAGTPVANLGGSGPAVFSSPAGIAADADGVVYVGNSGNGSVKVVREATSQSASSENGSMFLAFLLTALACAGLALIVAGFASVRARAGRDEAV